jgi:2'-5' RNA ligase
MRLFVALPLPDAVRDALLDPMEGLAGARWQDADNLHITLRFIGEVDRHQADDIACALAQVTVRDFVVELAGVGHFERKGHATAIWARVMASRELSELQASVEYACRRAGCEAEGRKFVPHVTLARLNRTSGDITGWLARNEGLSLGPWHTSGFALYESCLAPGGSIYNEIAHFPAQPG